MWWLFDIYLKATDDLVRLLTAHVSSEPLRGWLMCDWLALQANCCRTRDILLLQAVIDDGSRAVQKSTISVHALVEWVAPLTATTGHTDRVRTSDRLVE